VLAAAVVWLLVKMLIIVGSGRRRPMVRDAHFRRRGDALVVVRGFRGRRLVQEVGRVQFGPDAMECLWSLSEIEAVGEVVGADVDKAKAGKVERLFGKVQEAPKLVLDVRDIAVFGIW